MEALAALADPIRRELVACSRGELAAGSSPAGSRSAARDQPPSSGAPRGGLVRARIDGKRRLYALDPRPLRELDDWLEPYRDLWAQRLDALDTEIARGRRAQRAENRHDRGPRDPRGVVTTEDDGRQRLEFRRSWPDPIEDVWPALTEPDRLARWIGTYEGERGPVAPAPSR